MEKGDFKSGKGERRNYRLELGQDVLSDAEIDKLIADLADDVVHYMDVHIGDVPRHLR